ncbi:MAG: PD-(D/E)XK nuclease family protein [Oscillospiraceae bacterium]|nr:PD-(D/E)XK nuclease family protein [Oscillospiraceae bacterium]
MVKFIVGKADLNISAAVRGELISLLENNAGKQKIVYIVPDQFEYETEKAIYRILDEKDLLRRFYEINITTFSRLCREILEECGEHRPLADDIVKNIIMHKSVSENKNALAALGKVAARPGFCGKMVKTISALKTSGITARDLGMSLNAISKIDKKLTAEMPIMKKLYETNTLYTNYEGLLSEYVDKLDVTGMAADSIAKAKCAVFDNANVFVDCFNDFTQSQLQFLMRVIGRADNVTFGFTAQLDSDCDVFRTANNHISRLRQEAEENGLSVEFVTDGIESRFPDNSTLCGLSKHLFQTAKNRDELGGACELVRAHGVYDELDYAAAKIKELTLDKGLRYNEIAVLCTNVGAYGKYVESVFKKYDIPIFLDTLEPILYQPLINLVNSILNALENFSVDTVLSCVKTKFFAKPKTALDDGDEDETNDETDSEDRQYIALSDKDIDIFESYIYEWDLKTNHLKKPFTFIDKRAANDRDRQTAEQVRTSVAVPLLELQKQLKKSGSTVNGAEITELLYDFLINKVGMRRAIFKRCKNEENSALDADKVALYQRLWNSLVDILNKLHKELSDVNVTIGEYVDIFREICAAATLADPPQFIDCVLVGDIDRTRADNIKAAFIVGASYDAFPTPASEAGIFSQYEIELIYDKIVHIESDKKTADDISPYIEKIARIADTGRHEYCLNSVKDQYYLSLYRAYRAMTLPTEYLCISCPDADASGESLVRSDVFGEIMSTFKNTEITNAESKGNRFYCRTLKAAKMRYAMGLNERSDENLTLRKVLENEDVEFVEALDEIRELRSDVVYDKNGGDFSGKHTLKAPTARLLFSDKIGTTAIEKLNICKFRYFCEFGLKIDERNKRSFTRSKRGEAIHFIFQKVLEEYCGDMDAFFALRRSELLSLSKKYLAEYRENETNNDSTEDKRTEYLFNNIANSATDVLITMQTELYARKYRPKFFELNIKSDPENNRHAIIDNEGQPQNDPPAAEIFSSEEKMPSAHKTAEIPDDASYLITAPLVIKLDDGTEVTVQGIIDRVDMFKADTNDSGKPIAYIRVVDYKSSVHSFDLHNAQNGINIQMLLYLFALQSANENNPTLELRPGGVNYIPSNNNGAANEPISPYRLLAMNYHESGLFIKDEVTESDLNNYTEHISKMLESDSSTDNGKIEGVKKTFEPTKKNLAERKFINALRDDIMKKISENLNAIFGGTIDALPTVYYETLIKPDGGEKSKLREPCEHCRFGDICRNAGKNVNKLERAKLKPKTAKPDDDKTYWENKYITEGGEE